jgi:hypothetical protein
VSASAKDTLIGLQTVNGLLVGARIEKVLLGRDGEDALLVIETDRRHPELGGAYTLQLKGSFAACVAVSLIERLPGELLKP